MSTLVPNRQPSFTNRVFGVLGVLSVVGMVLLTVTALVGFEEPNITLFLTSLLGARRLSASRRRPRLDRNTAEPKSGDGTFIVRSSRGAAMRTERTDLKWRARTRQSPSKEKAGPWISTRAALGLAPRSALRITISSGVCPFTTTRSCSSF